jgi:hypothetical protein
LPSGWACATASGDSNKPLSRETSLFVIPATEPESVIKSILKRILKQVQDDKVKVSLRLTLSVIPAAEPESIKSIWF